MTEIIRISSFLRFVLLADAATCLVCGLTFAGGGGILQNLLGLPGDLLFYTGLGLFPFAAFLLYVATRKSVSKTVVWIVISLNALWTIDSFLLLFSGYVAPTTFGYVFVTLQPLGVALFADLEFIGLRKAEVVVFHDAKEMI